MKRTKIATVLMIVLLLAGCGGGEGTATAMKLARTEGTVGVSDEKGEAVSPVENLSLYGGYGMGTEEKSHAWIDLDSVKLAKMDEDSEIEIQKEGKALEIVINSGGLFFHVEEPLEEDETFDIRTSTMMTGIRGTCGWVRMFDETHMEVFILEGTVECTVTDPESGESKTESVSGGEKAQLMLYSGDAPQSSAPGDDEENPEGLSGETSGDIIPEGETCAILKETFELHEIPFYILEELLADEALTEKINEGSELKIPADNLPQGYVDMGRQYLEHDGSETAFALSELALEADPKLPDAWSLRGSARIFGGETEENFTLSQTDYEKALELSEADAEAYLGLADLRIRQQDYEGALSLLEEGLEKAGGDAELTEKIAELESGTITDAQHRRRRYSFFDEGGSLAWYHEYSYDEQGRQSRLTSHDASGAQTGAGEYLYDEEGRKVQTLGWYNTSGIPFVETYEIGENGHWAKTYRYNTDGELVDYSTYEYDDKGHRIRQDQYDPEGNLKTYYLSEYDEGGQMVRQENHSSDGTLSRIQVYERNQNGQCVRLNTYDGDGTLISYFVYEYDAEGNRISSQKFTVGE